jgi:hypothetical protein
VVKRHGRQLIAGAICAAAAALFIAISAEQADAQGTVAATAVSYCGHSQIASAKRSLSSANRTLLQKKCAAAHRSLTTVSFLQNPKHHWMLAPRYHRWWQVPNKKWRHTVRRARALLRYHQARLEEVAAQIQQLSFPSWLKSSFTCIHHFEGAWTSDTGNGYYGGLQMDAGFQNTYGPEFIAQWGTANNWPVWAQLEAAKRAYMSGRGFGPWPNTARACHLSTSSIISSSSV